MFFYHRFVATTLSLLALQLLNVHSVVGNVVGCGCVTVTTWNQLVSAIDGSPSTLLLCPFDIAKPAESNLRLENKSIRLICEKSDPSQKCKLRGEGNIVRIAGARSEVMIEGFTFEGATDAALRIAPTSPKTQTLHECEFIGNRGSSKWRGGAIKTEPDTNLVISSCLFSDNYAGQGGAIFHRGDFMRIIDSTFERNTASQGGAIQSDFMAGFEVYDSKFEGNVASNSPGGSIAVKERTDIIGSSNVEGSGNLPCNGIHIASDNSCDRFDSSPNDFEPFVPGVLSIKAQGLRLSSGLKVTFLAKTDQKVALTSPEAKQSLSLIPFHKEPDGAAVFALDDGGWIYASNSEVAKNQGGVFGLEFDSSGRPRDYVALLKGTNRNCAGGVTPWNTWVSCEEYSGGQCWQVDPTGQHLPEPTKLVEEAGGNFESMAVDFRDPNSAKFFVTEDHPRGALRRFRPPAGTPPSWDMIHKEGTLDYLEFLSGSTFRWTKSLSAGRQSAFDHYPNVEGISHHEGILSFVSKVKKQIFHLDLDRGTYSVSSTYLEALQGGGSFEAGPDQIVQQGDTLYFTEDGGGSPGVYVYDGARHYTLFEAYVSRFIGDETTGIAFSPDGTKFYACLQENGFLYQFERDDGLPFEGGARRLVGMKYHLDRHKEESPDS